MLDDEHRPRRDADGQRRRPLRRPPSSACSTTASATSSCCVTSALTRVDGGLAREVDAVRRTADELAVATLQRREPRRRTTAGEVRPARGADRRTTSRAPDIVARRGDPGQQRRRRTIGRHGATQTFAAPDRRDRGGRRADATSSARSTRSTTRTAAQPGGNIRVGVPLPHRSRARRSSTGRVARSTTARRRRPAEQQGAAPLQPGPHRSGERRVDQPAASRSPASSPSGARRSS